MSSNMSKKSKYFLVVISTLIVASIAAVSISTLALHVIHQKQLALLDQEKIYYEEIAKHWHYLNEAEDFYHMGDYANCINNLDLIPSNSSFYQRAQKLIDMCYQPMAESWLAEAKDLAAQGSLLRAINVATQIQGSQQIEAIRQIKVWTQEIFNFASKNYFSSGEEGYHDAVKTLGSIPNSNPLYNEAQALLRLWQAEWSANSQHFEIARSAHKEGDFKSAEGHAQQISDHPFWMELRTLLITDIQNTRQQIEQDGQQVIRYLEQGSASEALQLASSLPNYEPWGERKATWIAQASEMLLLQEKRKDNRFIAIVMTAISGAGIGFLARLRCR